jgi:type I restriction enzyme S subunit
MTWHEVSLKQICNVDWGNTKLTKSSYVADGKFLAVSAAGADGLIDYYEHEANVPVLSAIGAQCGRMFYPGARFTAIKNTITLTPKDNMADGKFLYYLFTSVELPQRGAGQPFISKGDIESFKVFIPESLEEQRQIVQKLDSSFAEINAMEGNLKLNDGNIEQLQQSILSLSFNKPQNNSGDGEPSPDQVLDVKFVKLVDACKLVGGGTPSKANPNFYLGDIPWATVRDMRSRWLVDTEHKINAVAVRESSTNVIPSGNVVLASRVGLGKVMQLRQDTAINQDLRALIPRDVSKIDSNYLYYWTLSIAPEIVLAGKGATVQGVTLPFLENLMIPLPSLEKQKEIIAKLDSAFSHIEALRLQSRLKKEYATAVRDSLLSHALIQEEAVA